MQFQDLKDLCAVNGRQIILSCFSVTLIFILLHCYLKNICFVCDWRLSRNCGIMFLQRCVTLFTQATYFF